MPLPALADNLFQAAWTIVCVTLLHIAVYRVAHKDLRAWIAVNKLFAGRTDASVIADDLKAESEAQSERGHGQLYLGSPVAEDQIQSLLRVVRIWAWILALVLSLAAPFLLSIGLQLYASGDKGYLDVMIIAATYFSLTLSIAAVFTLSETEVGILPVPVTKQNSHGWSVVDSTGKVICIRALNIEAAVNNIPTASLVVCSSVLLARLAPLSAAYSSLLVGMMMLLPVHIIRVTRGGNIKMKHWLLGCGLGAVALTVFALIVLIAASNAPRDPVVAEKTPSSLVDKLLTSSLSVLGNDLVRVFQYSQYAYVFPPLMSLLRYDYHQSRNEPPKGESAKSAERMAVAEDTTQEKSIFEPSINVPGYVAIPMRLSPFSAPTFTSSIIGSYLGTVIAVLIFPTPNLCVLWMPASFIGQSLGGALSVSWNHQWKSLWRYEEIWKLSDAVDC